MNIYQRLAIRPDQRAFGWVSAIILPTFCVSFAFGEEEQRTIRISDNLVIREENVDLLESAKVQPFENSQLSKSFGAILAAYIQTLDRPSEYVPESYKELLSDGVRIYKVKCQTPLEVKKLLGDRIIYLCHNKTMGSMYISILPTK